jgi:hypothetical protein
MKFYSHGLLSGAKQVRDWTEHTRSSGVCVRVSLSSAICVVVPHTWNKLRADQGFHSLDLLGSASSYWDRQPKES